MREADGPRYRRGRKRKPRADPAQLLLFGPSTRVVCGVVLDDVEAGLFDLAVASGELAVAPDLPVWSGLPLAWERWCAQEGRPCRVREVPAPCSWRPPEAEQTQEQE